MRLVLAFALIGTAANAQQFPTVPNALEQQRQQIESGRYGQTPQQQQNALGQVEVITPRGQQYNPQPNQNSTRKPVYPAPKF